MNKRRTTMRPGYTMIEFALALVLIAILIGAVYITYKTLRLSTMTTKKVSEIGLVIGAAERVRSVNNDAFVAASTNIGAIPKMDLELGGSNGSQTIKTWSYRCVSSSNSIVTIVTSRYISVDLRDSVLQKVNVDYQPWVFATSGSAASPTITITQANVPCQ